MKVTCKETILDTGMESVFDAGSVYDFVYYYSDYKVKDNNGDWHVYGYRNFHKYFSINSIKK
jgi:hypothetical protein